MWIEFHPGGPQYFPEAYKILKLREFFERQPEKARYTYTKEGREDPLGLEDLLEDGLHAWKHVAEERRGMVE